MIVTFLGTGTSSGVPMVACQCIVCSSDDPRDKRLRSSVMVELNEKRIIIDTGPDFRQQMLRENIRRVDALLLTHEHKDHIAGLDDVRGFNFVNNSAMDVFATIRVQEALKREFQYIFSGNFYPGLPKIELHTIDKSKFQACGIPIAPVEALHYKLPVLGFRIHDFCYITDAKTISEEEKLKIMNVPVLVLNALRKEEHVSHLTLSEAISLSKEVNAGITYLTHISHQLGRHAEVEMELPSNIRIAYDGLKLEL